MMKETHLLFDGEAGENEDREPVCYTLCSREVVVGSDTIAIVSEGPSCCICTAIEHENRTIRLTAV